MKIKKSDINILIGFIGIALAFCSYFLVYRSFSEKTNTLKIENAALQEEVDALQALADNKAFYEAETARMDEENQEIISHFPSEVRAEDQILYAYGLEQRYDVWAKEMTLEGTQLIQVAANTPQQQTNDAVVDGDAPANDAVVATGGLRDTVFLYTSPFTITYKATYRSTKEIIQNILELDDRMSITGITISYDGETGGLTGNIDATNYTMSGTDAVYIEPTIVGVRTGTADPFWSAPTLTFNYGMTMSDEEGAEGEDAATE